MATKPPSANRQIDSHRDTRDLTTIARIKTVEEIGKTVRTLLVFGAAVSIMYFVAGMVHDLAGKQTAAELGLKFLGTLNIGEGLAWAIAAICGGVAGVTRRTNGEMAKRMTRLAELEQSIDPKRSSSHLTPTGSPREEDK